MKNSSPKNTLLNAAKTVIIVAHKEDTSALNASLRKEGFDVEEVRGPYSAVEINYSAAMRCFVNHANAWRRVVKYQRPCLVVEADFVPCVGFGGFMPPVRQGDLENSLGYLYAVGPQFWDLENDRVMRGHAGGMVALYVHPHVAGLMLDFFQEKTSAVSVGEYSAWDSELGYWLKKRCVESYLPYRHYGEHGGIGNPEHKAAGLGRPHQADVLASELHFLPAYAKSCRLRYVVTRVRAKIWGIIRLCAGRVMAVHDIRRGPVRRLIKFLVFRILSV
jgi:hypothetical protein